MITGLFQRATSDYDLCMFQEMKTYREAPAGGPPPAPNQSTPPQQPHQPPQMQHMQQQNTMPPQHMPQQQQLPMQLFDNEHAEYDNRIM